MLRRLDLRLSDSHEEPAIGLADALGLSWFASPGLTAGGPGEEDVTRSGETVVSLLYSTVEQNASAIEANVRAWLDAFGLPAATLQVTDYEEHPDWMEPFRQFFQPLRIGDDILVLPAWLEPEEAPAVGCCVLRIDPGMAFGTGTHETTRLCLQLLRDIPVAGQDILDLGAGSGILAFYLMKRGASHGVAVEIEGAAVENLRKNAALNDIGPDLEILCADLFSFSPTPPLKHRSGKCFGRRRPRWTREFDGVVANLTSPVLHEGLPVFSRWVKPGGWGVFSGIGVANVAGIRDALRQHQWELLQELQEGDWHGLRARFRGV